MDEKQSAKPPSSFLEVDYADLEFYERCGGGAYGSVYRAKWKSRDMIVAVKKVLVLEKEAQVLSSLRHKNIILFHGAVTKPPNYCLVTEYASMGSLYAYLASHQGDKMLDFQEILTWALDIAQGMNYLHTDAPETVIHRDLKSKNIVITSDSVCKLCDFGASRFHGSTTKMTLAGTLPWMAPEVIESKPTSRASDVWSFGVVLWELLTHEIPFKGFEGLQIAWLVVEKHERLTIPTTCPAILTELMTQCWHKEPKKRPNFEHIITQLRALQTDDTIGASYMKDRSLWKFEIEHSLERLGSVPNQRELELKTKELEEREKRLVEREQTLERQQYLQKLNSHDVNTWSEVDVDFWLKQVVSQDHMRDLVCYLNLFHHHNISGHRLLLLTTDDLMLMGINSVGHLKALQDEIEQLKLHNKRMMDFPPLENTFFEPPQLSELPAARVKLILIFGSHIRRGSSEKDHKWKMYVEVDDNDDHLAKNCIKKVSFRYQESEQVVQEPPFVMERWYTGIWDDTIVECVVSYQSLVKKPKSSRYHHKIRLDTCKVHQREVTLSLKPTVTCPKSPNIRIPVPSRKNSPTFHLLGAWQSRIIAHSPTPRSPPPGPSAWARIVDGRLNSSATSSPRANRKASLPTKPSASRLEGPTFQRTISAPASDIPSPSRKNSKDKGRITSPSRKNSKDKGRKTSPSATKSSLLKTVGFRIKHRRGSKVKREQQQLNGTTPDMVKSASITLTPQHSHDDSVVERNNSDTSDSNLPSDVSSFSTEIEYAMTGVNGEEVCPSQEISALQRKQYEEQWPSPSRIKKLSTSDSGCQLSPDLYSKHQKQERKWSKKYMRSPQSETEDTSPSPSPSCNVNGQKEGRGRKGSVQQDTNPWFGRKLCPKGCTKDVNDNKAPVVRAKANHSADHLDGIVGHMATLSCSGGGESGGGNPLTLIISPPEGNGCNTDSSVSPHVKTRKGTGLREESAKKGKGRGFMGIGGFHRGFAAVAKGKPFL